MRSAAPGSQGPGVSAQYVKTAHPGPGRDIQGSEKRVLIKLWYSADKYADVCLP